MSATSSAKLRVVLTTEGTYPYCTGGVSTWADILIRELNDIEFCVLAIMMNPFQSIKFELPPNVARLINVPLWGTEEPAEYISGQPFAEIFLNKLKSNEPIQEEFREIVELLVCSIYASDPDLDALGRSLVRMYEICGEYDYRNIFRSEWLWNHFYQLLLRIHRASPLFEIGEFPPGAAAPLAAGLLLRVRERFPKLRVTGQGMAGLNQVLQSPGLFELIPADEAAKLSGELRELAAQSLVARSQESRRLSFFQERQLETLNRLTLEELFAPSPRYRDKPYHAPSVYDCVENLRWIYRFLITLLAPLPEAEVYHSSAAAFCGLPCIIAKLKFGSKFMLTEHGIYVREQYLYASREKFPPHTKRFLMGLICLVSRLNYHFADRILPVCHYNKRWELQFRAEEQKIAVIYNGIDTERFRHLEIERSTRPTVVMVARIDPLKDIETFIRTCAEVRLSIGDVLFKLYGPVPDEGYHQKCQALVRELGLEGNFQFAGLTLTPEIANNEGDIVLLTSISEAFPFSVIEAMACEKLVISSDVGGTSEVLEGYGFVVQPRNHREFAERVVHALGNPALCAEMGVEARQKILKGFRTRDMVEGYRDIYHLTGGRAL
jgi:glycosyltransferase involved in cell wall biosynthesis